MEVPRAIRPPRKHEVYRPAHQIERRPALHYGLIHIETPVEPSAHARGRYPTHPCEQRERPAHQPASYARGSEHLVATLLRAQPYFRAGYVMSFFRGGKRHHHDHTRTDKEVDRRIGRAVERVHKKPVCIARAVGCEILPRRQSAERHTYEIHKVVAREGHGQSKRAHQHNHLQHINLQRVERLHHDGENPERTQNDYRRMGVYPRLHGRSHKRHIGYTLQQQKINYRRSADTTKNADFPLQAAPVVEGKHCSCKKLHQCSEKECYGYRKENAQNHRKGFFSVEEFAEPHTGTCGHLDQRHDKCGSQKFENHRHSSRRRHSERIEHIQKNNVRNHHGHENADDFVEREILRTENAVAGYIHHAVAHGGSHEDTHRRNKQHTLQRRGFRSERRRKEVDGIIAHAHPEVEHGEHEKKDNYSDK